MRLSLAGSTGWFGSTYSSRLPLPLVSRTSDVQPCDFCSSPVSSNILTFSQPTASPPPPLLVHNVLFASFANCRWCVLKQVSINVTFFVFGSYTASCRPELVSGKAFADGLLDPCLQKAGLSFGRIFEVNQTRPFSSSMGLCTLALLFQIGSSPQYAEGVTPVCAAANGVLGSRTGTVTRLVVW